MLAGNGEKTQAQLIIIGIAQHLQQRSGKFCLITGSSNTAGALAQLVDNILLRIALGSTLAFTQGLQAMQLIMHVQLSTGGRIEFQLSSRCIMIIATDNDFSGFLLQNLVHIHVTAQKHLHAQHLVAAHKHANRNVSTILITMLQLQMTIADSLVSVAKGTSFNRDGNLCLVRQQLEAFDIVGLVRQISAAGNKLLYSTIAHTKIQAVIKNIFTPFNCSTLLYSCGSSLRSCSLAGQGLQSRCFYAYHAHILLHLFRIFVQVIMIYCCTSCYSLVRVQRHNRLQAEEFAQAVSNHIEFAHTAIDNYGIYLHFITQLGGTFL